MTNEELILKSIEEIGRHIAVLNEEFGTLSIDVATLKADVAILKWFMLAVLGAIVAGSIWFKKKNS